MDTNKTLDIIEYLLEEEDWDDDHKDALLHSLEALVAMDNIWNMVSQLTFDLEAQTEGMSAADKYEICLTAVSQIGNELAAASMFLAGSSPEIPEVLRKMGNNYLAGTEDVAAGTMIKEAHDRLAAKIDMTRQFRDATISPPSVDKP